MPKTDVKLYSTDAATGTKQTTTISYVNPTAGNTVLKSFAQQLNNLTTNNYSSSDKIETLNLDTEDETNQAREITVTNAGRNQTATITFNRSTTEAQYGGATPQVFYYSAAESTTEKLSVSSISSQDPTKATYNCTIPDRNGTLYIGLVATDYFVADFIKTTIG